MPDGEPLWFLYEVDEQADAVLRNVEVFPDGRITRNSIEIEQRKGHRCRSLIDCSLADGFSDAKKQVIAAAKFEAFWRRGVETPWWFP